MANNKVQLADGTVLMDITDTTAEASDVAAGKAFYSASGLRSIGTGNYMATVTNPTANDILITDANGQAVDSGVSINDIPENTSDLNNDSGFITGLEILSYGTSTWQNFLDAYTAQKVVYCRASSNSDPSVGSQTRLAFMAYVDNASAESITKVEFQYYRTIASHSYVQQGDQVYVYTLDKNNGWSVVVREAATRVVAGTGMSMAYSNGELTLNALGGGTTSEATDSDYGVIKLNSSEGINTNENGQLTVNGRLGQHSDGGVFYPATIEPSGVSTSSFLMTDGAKGVKLGSRAFAIMAGAAITCRSAAAGATQYWVANKYANRFICAAAVGGRAALNLTDAGENGTAEILSIKFANGSNISAYFGPDESANDIIITLDRTVNPSAATTTLRLYGTSVQGDNILVGQGVGASGGKVISLGQCTYASGNQNIAFGNSVHVTANNSVGLGHTMLINKQYCFGVGAGHDFTYGTNGTAAVGVWSTISSNTKFVVGAGTANGDRKNIFEVTNDNGQTGVILLSPNGTKYKLAVDNSGNLSTTAV